MKFINYIFVILLSGIILSCGENVLDVTPKDQLSNKTVWSSPDNTDLFLNDIYNQLPDMFNMVDAFDNWTDNSLVSYTWPGSKNVISAGLVRPSTVYQTYTGLNQTWMEYGHNYDIIRKCNVFIRNVSDSDLPDDYKKERLAEARFLRAYFYQILWMEYGGVPIVKNVPNKSTQGDQVFHERSTFEDTYNFIISQCDSAAANLPVEWSGSDAGRATKGAALTLKGWVELFAASPTFNTSNPPEGSSKLVSFGNFDQNRWKAAASTFQKVIDLNTYSLHPDYEQLFFNDHNSEIIFARQYKANVKGGYREGYMGPTYINGSESAWGGQDPTQDLVDAYAMDNGKPITDPTSGYDPQNPYKDRSERFYESIVYDGSVWQGDTIYTRVGIGSKNQIDLSNRGDAGDTGYYVRKEVDESINGAANIASANAGHDFIFFRYADVLLDYAEAQNEFNGPDQSVYDAVNKVRARVDLPGLPTGLNQDEMRTAIHRERRVELAFEAKRWWDLMRWRVAGNILNSPIHGIKIEEQNGSLNYSTVPVFDKKFDPTKNYVLPIPQYVIDQNPKVKQNPGY